jgi:hypothetical protein
MVVLIKSSYILKEVKLLINLIIIYKVLVKLFKYIFFIANNIQSNYNQMTHNKKFDYY